RNEKILPACSPTKNRLSPGARARSSGLLKRSFGKARSMRYGCGGSGEPVMREVVHGTRLSMPNGLPSRGAAEVAGTVGRPSTTTPADRARKVIARTVLRRIKRIRLGGDLRWLFVRWAGLHPARLSYGLVALVERDWRQRGTWGIIRRVRRLTLAWVWKTSRGNLSMKMLNCSVLSAVVLMLPFVGLRAADAPKEGRPAGKVVLVIHGGAGDLPGQKVPPKVDKEYREVMEQALQAGYMALKREKGTSLDAVEAAIRVLEDSPLYNAGKGAVFTSEGRNELDASIMEGKELRAGAGAGVTISRNPITAARAVMEKSKHVLLTGRGAELFATQQNLDIVGPSYFWTLKRWNELKEAQQKEKDAKRRKDGGSAVPMRPRYFGTVGAVALDRSGNLAAGTSTGGMTNKRPGRLGDSPIIGAGTYAGNDACGVSCTGHGEYFIRYAVSHDIVALVKYKGLT